MFPPDAITFTDELVGGETTNIITATSESPVTVLAVRMQQSGSQSETLVYCGSEQVAHNYNKDYAQDLMNYVCTDLLKVEKTGMGDNAFVTVTYVPYNRTELASTIGTSSPFFLSHSYTFGDLTVALLLIPLVAITLYQTVILAFRKPIRFSK